MELLLLRVYFPEGTNGELYYGNEPVCYTIELPWRGNQQGVSCIPEGRYRLVHRYSQRYGKHLMVQDVPGRSLILVHAANNAAKELRGCIALVSQLAGAGKGLQSRLALRKLNDLVRAAGDNEPIFLTIKTKEA